MRACTFLEDLTRITTSILSHEHPVWDACPLTSTPVSTHAYRGIFAAGFIVRPIGALLFGHVGDATARSRSLTLSIIIIAFATIAIGILPGKT
jgi:MFS family permease